MTIPSAHRSKKHPQYQPNYVKVLDSFSALQILEPLLAEFSCLTEWEKGFISRIVRIYAFAKEPRPLTYRQTTMLMSLYYQHILLTALPEEYRDSPPLGKAEHKVDVVSDC